MKRGLYNHLNLKIESCRVQYQQNFEVAYTLYFIIIFIFLSTKYLFHLPNNLVTSVIKCYVKGKRPLQMFILR